MQDLKLGVTQLEVELMAPLSVILDTQIHISFHNSELVFEPALLSLNS